MAGVSSDPLYLSYVHFSWVDNRMLLFFLDQACDMCIEDGSFFLKEIHTMLLKVK